jgi:hypothetical protein
MLKVSPNTLKKIKIGKIGLNKTTNHFVSYFE